MIIQWYGHACFRFQAQQQEATVVTDPFCAELGIRPPKLSADILVITTDSKKHNNSDAVRKGDQEMFAITHPGEFEVQGVFLQGKAVRQEKGWTSIWTCKMDDIIIGHLGAIDHVPTEQELEFLGKIDILLLPVGGHDVLEPKRAVEAIGALEPRIVIPMCYKIPGVEAYQLLDVFMKEYGLKEIERLDKIKVMKKDLPADERRIVGLNPS